jgi:transcription antitermination factor NusG
MHGTIPTPDRQWYVLQIAPNRERAAKSFLSPTDAEIDEARAINARLSAYLIGRRFKPYIPMMREKRTRGIRRCKIVVERPLFPGYAFLQLSMPADKDRLHFVFMAPGVIDFVRYRDSKDYAVVPQEHMERIGRIEAAALVPRAKAKPFQVGEEVRVNDGPFIGLRGNIFEMTDGERIKVLVSLFGRKSVIHMDEDQLEKL